MEITIDKDHVYRVDGVITPGVTETINKQYPYQCWHKGPREKGYGDPHLCPDCIYCRALGTAVHSATAYSDRGTLELSTVHADVMPRLKQWWRLLETLKPEVVAIEKKVHFRGMVCGTLDRVWMIDKRRTLMDLKPPTVTIASKLQTAAYFGCWNEMLPKEKIQDRLIVHLDGSDNPAKLEPHNDPSDWPAFLNLLSFKNRGKKNKIS